ncbi:MAG TPA: FIST N-terminal domain-containing protein [Chloroflexota bacterium]|nr:FIST N-terminal domain-containing protein [Chloroflexota bacterium]
MRIEQVSWNNASGWVPQLPGKLGESAQVVFLFADTPILKQQGWRSVIREAYPNAHLLGCSTAGTIRDTQVLDDALVATAVAFERSEVRGVQVPISHMDKSFEAGEQLAKALPHEGLVHVFVLSDGLHVNGSELVKGLSAQLPPGVSITGGLSGDGARFEETTVLWDQEPQQRSIAALGLYGGQLKVGYGSLGGWDPFGPERLITRSQGSVLYELDGQPALALYKRYLGEHASGLPATGLLFPLSLRTRDGADGIVRTILSVDEGEQSLTFAGDMPVGAHARLMKANFDRLIDGAVGAARTSYEAVGSTTPDLGILISCVGRKLILKQRIEEEVEGVREALGDGTVLTGFYSYGEISPFTPNAKCELHNQTMTITTLSER